MKRRDLLICLAASAGVAGCVGHAPPSVVDAGRYSAPVELPEPVRDGPVSLERAILARRSARSFRPAQLSRATLGQLLWAAQGETSPDGKRASPSAGALYPLELYVVIPREVLHYLPHGHRVEARTSADLRSALRSAAFGQDHVAAAPAVLVVAAAADRTRRKYGRLADAFVDREVGHAAQNILLTAAALGLAAVPVGSVDGAACARVLALPPGQHVHYLIPVGRPL